MRYRPFGNSGMAVSAVSLMLRDGGRRGREGDYRAQVLAALEAGINCFELAGASPVLLEAVGEALSAVDRRLVFVTWGLDARECLGLSAQELSAKVQPVVDGAGLAYIDLLMLHDPREAPSLEAISRLKDFQESGAARLLGVSGDSDFIDGYMTTGAFDAISTTYNLVSGWKERNRVKRAAERDMAVIGCDVWPKSLSEMKIEPMGKRGLFGPRPHPLKGVGGYHFLTHTPGWTAEEISLAYALTEPAIATAQVEGADLARLKRLADVPERDLPTGVAAQIEMARFSAPPPARLDPRGRGA